MASASLNVLSAAACGTAAASSRRCAQTGGRVIACRLSTYTRLAQGRSLFRGSGVLAAGSRPHSRIQQWSLQVRAASSSNGAGNGAPEQYDFDLFTIGAGSGGTRASRMAAQNHGAKVAVCELPFGYISSDSVGGAGGTCVLRGCVPKKLVVYASSFTQEFAESRGFGWNTPENIELDWKKFQDKKNQELQRLNGVYDKLLAKAGVTYMEGMAFVKNVFGDDADARPVYENVASAVFTAPQLATCGLTGEVSAKDSKASPERQEAGRNS